MSIEHFRTEENLSGKKRQPVLYRVYTTRGVVPGFLKESKVTRGIETGSLKDVVHIEVITSINEAV